jgi:hypothetical protein
MNSKITKEGTKETEDPEKGIEYKITYTNKIEDYNGKAKITIIDLLPYKIDESKSILDGGTYDANTRTITWEQNETIEGTKEIEITKEIKLVYKDVDLTSDRIVNTVKAKIELIEVDQKNEVEETFETTLIAKGKVIARYVDEEGKELEKEEESKGYIGEKYKTEEKKIKYYKLIKEPENKEGEYTKEDIEVTYVYRRMLFNLGIDKVIKEITRDGKKVAISNNKLAKVEIPKKEADKIKIKVKYGITVKNTEEIEGTAEIVEYIPVGFKATESTLKEWKITKEGTLTREVELKAGETKEYEIELQWENDADKLGYIMNKVELSKVNNPAKFKDEKEVDNQSEAGVILGIKTGVDWKYRMTITFMATVTLLGVTIVTKKK